MGFSWIASDTAYSPTTRQIIVEKMLYCSLKAYMTLPGNNGKIHNYIVHIHVACLRLVHVLLLSAQVSKTLLTQMVQAVQ